MAQKFSMDEGGGFQFNSLGKVSQGAGTDVNQAFNVKPFSQEPGLQMSAPSPLPGGPAL